MRLFTGVDLPEDVREKLERLLMHLRPCAHLKWSPVYNLHVTLKFIGEWPEDKLPHLEKEIVSRHPYDTPEFLVLPLGAGAEKYLAWLGDSVR